MTQQSEKSRKELLTIIRNHALDYKDQAAIARKCNVTPQTVINVLRGESDNLLVLEAIAECAEKYTRREAVFQRLKAVADSVCHSFGDVDTVDVEAAIN